MSKRAASKAQAPARITQDGDSGRYQLLGQLGRGGMAEVDRVLDTSAGRELALHRCLLTGQNDDDRELLFRREFHTLANLRHPGIVDVYEYGVDDRGPYYTMELLVGGDLRERAPTDP